MSARTPSKSTSRQVLEYCLAKPGAWRDEPWDGDVVVKVADKIFAFLGSMDGETVGVKCGRDSSEAAEWRERYPSDVRAMAYIGRYGWNTFTVGQRVADDDLFEVIDASYADVVARLPKAKRP